MSVRCGATVRRVSTYFKCRWRHHTADEPVVLYEELDDQRMETRKVHEYGDGRLIRTDRLSDDDVTLSWEPLPPETQIAGQPEFDVSPLTRDEFNVVWSRATYGSV